MKTITAVAEVWRHILETGQTIMDGKGGSAVGLTEILNADGVPKGSFYYYFKSKDAFGEALLEQYFADYMAEITVLLEKPEKNGAERLMTYWENGSKLRRDANRMANVWRSSRGQSCGFVRSHA